MMARKPRIQDRGMIHHVIVRGNNSQDIFKDNNDRVRYLHLLHRYKDRFKFKVLAYCFMDNHIHLLLKQSDTKLSKFMQGLQQSYTQYFNCKYNESGHVFEQRFKSFPCSDEAYYLSLIAYIHNNPKKAGIVEKVDKYEWSSHKEIINPNVNNLCDIEELFKIIGRDRGSSIDEYLWLLGEVDEIEPKSNYMQEEELLISQSSEWFNDQDNIINSRKLTFDNIDAKIKLVERQEGIVLKLSDYRKVFSIIATNYSSLLNKDIANYLRLNPNSVSKIKRGFLDGKFNNFLNGFIDKVSEKINNEND